MKLSTCPDAEENGSVTAEKILDIPCDGAHSVA